MDIIILSTSFFYKLVKICICDICKCLIQNRIYSIKIKLHNKQRYVERQFPFRQLVSNISLGDCFHQCCKHLCGSLASSHSCFKILNHNYWLILSTLAKPVSNSNCCQQTSSDELTVDSASSTKRNLQWRKWGIQQFRREEENGNQTWYWIRWIQSHMHCIWWGEGWATELNECALPSSQEHIHTSINSSAPLARM